MEEKRIPKTEGRAQGIGESGSEFPFWLIRYPKGSLISLEVKSKTSQHFLMKREQRRTLSVPSINYPDNGMSSQQGAGGGVGTGWPPQQPLHSQSSLGSSFNRSRSASTSALSTPTGPGPSPSSGIAKKKVVTACQRCRTRKIRCDGVLPSCKSCVKAGVDCIEVDRTGDNNVPRR